MFSHPGWQDGTNSAALYTVQWTVDKQMNICQAMQLIQNERRTKLTLDLTLQAGLNLIFRMIQNYLNFEGSIKIQN